MADPINTEAAETVNPIIERAARALARRDSNGPGDESEWPSYTNDARAVLRAIREPFDAFDEPLAQAGASVLSGGSDHWQHKQNAKLVWQAMIDAALGEE